MTATGRACNLALTQVDLGLVGTERYIKAEVTSGGGAARRTRPPHAGEQAPAGVVLMRGSC